MKEWAHVVSLVFEGGPYDDHALDAAALQEILKYHKIVSETAKSLWYRDHPERERAPVGFAEQVNLYLTQIGKGSTQAVMESPADKGIFNDPYHYLKVGVNLTHEVYQAVEEDLPLPNQLLKSLVPRYQDLGTSLKEGQSLKIDIPGLKATKITATTSQKLEAFAKSAYADFIDITGKVLEVDVRRGRYEIWIDDRTSVKANFNKDQEREVTLALHDHQETELHVIGKGDFDDTGRPFRITQVDFLEVDRKVKASYDNTAESVWDMLRRFAEQVPEEEWEKLPTDLSENLDQYLYGDKTN